MAKFDGKKVVVDGVCAQFRPGLRTVALVEGRSGWTARLRSSGCDESKRGGEGWPAGWELEASRARATIKAVLGQRGSSGWMTRGVACRRSVAGMGAGVHSAEQLLCSLV